MNNNKTELQVKETETKLTGYPSIDKPWLKYQNDSAKNFTYPQCSIYEAIYEENRHRLDNIALSYGDTQISYGKLFDKIEERTEYFRNLGIKENDILTVSMLMTPEFVYDFYALSRLNALTNLIDPRTSIEGIKEYIYEANSKIILNTDIFTNKIYQAIANTDIKIINQSLIDTTKNLDLPLVVVSKLINFLNKCHYNNYDNFYLDCYKSNEEKLPSYKKNTPLTIVHTGGTTGFPKGVVLSHDNYNAMAYEYIKSNIGFMPKDKFLLIMPPWISYGSGMLHLSMVRGMEAIIIPKLESKKMGKYLITYKPQWFAGVPAHYKIIKDSKHLIKEDLSFIKGGAVGGDAMPASLFEEVNTFLIEKGAKRGVFPGYASTESTSAFAVRQNENYVPGSVGIPLPGCTVGVFKYDFENEISTDQELKYNEVGEICLNTENVMLGYFKNEELTNKVLKKHSDGKTWIHTGDLGYVSESGIIYINGRIKEMIIRHDGFKVYPNMIEKIILSHPMIDSVKVVGIKDPNHNTGSVPKVYLIPKKEYLNKEKDIIRQVKKIIALKLPKYYLPESYEVCTKLPLTAIGKIDIQKLQNTKVLTKKLYK